MPRNNKCPHLDNIFQLSLSELCRLKQGALCTQCDTSGPNLWICLHKNCLHIGCSEKYNNHSTIHYEQNTSHCIHVNQSSQRIWCYKCEMEVFLNDMYLYGGKINQHRRHTVSADEDDDDDDDEIEMHRLSNSDVSRYAQKILSAYDRSANVNISNGLGNSIIGGSEFSYGLPANGSIRGSVDYYDSRAEDDRDTDSINFSNSSGLVGMLNLGETCYMNAALQALSNTPALTGYFLECGDIIEANWKISAPKSSQKQIGLARNYCRLVRDMWSTNENMRYKRKNGFVNPKAILDGIRKVHMFNGGQQHDTQEFLRCFMDQLHKESEEVVPAPPDMLVRNNSTSTNSPTNSANSTNGFLHSTNSYLHFESADEDRSACSSPSLSQSEAEYETCDSGVSEQSSLSDEVVGNTHRSLPSMKHPSSSSLQSSQMQTSASNYSRSPSPTASQRTFKSSQSLGTMRSNRSNSVTSLNSLPMGATQSPPSQEQQPMSDPQMADSKKSEPKLVHRSIISDVFDGKLLSSVQCLTCDRLSEREETFQDLSLPIPGKDYLNVLHQSESLPPFLTPTGGLSSPNQMDASYQASQDSWFWWLWNWVRSFFWGPAVTLHDCMSAFFSADELKGDNMYSCEKCNKLRNGMKFSRVLELPEMMCIQLKRFRHDLSKISSPVNFPLVGLDMRPYLHKDCKSKISMYDLTAVICHHGTANGGHYTSFAKHELTGKWFEFDDQLVTEVSPEVVQNSEAYVLFYRKSNPQMSIIRNEAMRLEDIRPEHPTDIRFFVSRQWLNKFKTFAEPGPIDNWTMLCPHGGLSTRKAKMAHRLVVPLPQPLWDFLYKKFGGGPACNHLFECDICRQKEDALHRLQNFKLDALYRRRNYELDAFKTHKDETTSTIFAISMAWCREWQNFVNGVTDEEPGPINNDTIAQPCDGGSISRGVKHGSDYAQINSTLWKFFYKIYGGGPEIILRGSFIEDNSRVCIPAAQTTNPAGGKERDERSVTETNGDVQSTETTTYKEPCQVQVPQPTMPNQQQSTQINANLESKIEADKVPANPTSTTSATNAIDKAVNGKEPPKPANKVKIPKNVSFEDNDSDPSDRETSSSVSMYEQNVFNSRRGKHHYSPNATPPSEIVSKKDRRHRSSIKSNGFFGPEGKYSANNIPDEFNGTSNQTVSMSLTDESKRLDEITPLLHQASISTNGPILSTAKQHVDFYQPTNDTSTTIHANITKIPPQDGNEITNAIINLTANGSSKHSSHKSSYRKRFKTKSSRKSASFNDN